MRALAIAALAALAIARPASAEDVADARELLYLWNPVSVTISGGELEVVLPQDRITDQIYLSVITSGLCLGPLLDKPLVSVSNIAVLNRHGSQGYVFENGLEACETWNGRPAGDRRNEIEILGATHMR